MAVYRFSEPEALARVWGEDPPSEPEA